MPTKPKHAEVVRSGQRDDDSVLTREECQRWLTASVIETCDLCGDQIGLSDAELNAAGNQILCPKCRKQWSSPLTANPC